MIPQKNTVQVEGIGGAASRQMSIDIASLGHVMTVLGNLYSNPVLAVIREYSTNAMDSHIAAGKKDTPIRVTLPNTTNPQFSVEDFGTGLTEDEIYSIYGSYGASTKRESNDFNGQLGFGCKSAFSYSDQFTVTSTKDGKVQTFVFSLDADGIGEITKMEDRLTDAPNGVKVTIPVKLQDVNTFKETANKFYECWDVVPEGIHIVKREALFDAVTPQGNRVVSFNFGHAYTYTTYIVMGNVAYPVPKESMDKFHSMTSNRFRNLALYIYVKMGEVQFTPSREELKVTPNLLNILHDAFEFVVTSIKSICTTRIDAAKTYIDAVDISNKLETTYKYVFTTFGRDLRYKGYSLYAYSMPFHSVMYSLTNSGRNTAKLQADNITPNRKSYAYLLVPDKVEFKVVSGRYGGIDAEVKNLSGREVKAIRKYLMSNMENHRHLVFVNNNTGIPASNDIIGIPVLTLDDAFLDTYSPREKRTPVPRGIGLYHYYGPKANKLDSICRVDDSYMPAEGSEIVLLELDGNSPASKAIGNLPDHVSLHNEVFKGKKVYAARKGNIERIQKVYKVVTYESALIDSLKAYILANPVSAQASFELPVNNVGEVRDLWNIFGADTSGINDVRLVEVLKKVTELKQLHNQLSRAPKITTHVRSLEILTDSTEVKTLIHSLYTQSMEIPHLDEMLGKYPLLTVLSHADAKLQDVKDYVNAKEKYDVNV